ncbi:hypothetical protein DSL72_008679 [Monilinia vaccinii-corymbosi]|uniref:NACHT domain-containing protein n=1 Tax=Monilinia vaccinii-corymbosi TaxID=61207 RepID=A0A8A3PRW7_9HELO|nr:hypothetical protein DSL72_008679 [Monilinia vaccinii-corymbosi]
MGLSKSISAENLCELLKNISLYFNNVYLVIDALDECGDVRSNIVRLLAELNASQDSNIKILLTSRPETDIEFHLVGFEKVSIAAHKDDLELYVHLEIARHVRDERLSIGDQKLREEITQLLLNEAQGMFRWERILDRINLSSDDTKELVRRVLVWTVCSVTPLSLAQLLETVSINFSDKKLDRDGISNETKRCSSLVRKTEGRSGTRIELAHFSVKEFLLLKVQDDRYVKYRVSQSYQNAYIAKTCLTYLLFEDFRDIIPYTTETEKDAMHGRYAFYDYAATNFALHACGHSDDEDLSKLLRILFDPVKSNNFVSWAQVILDELEDNASTKKVIASASTLHFAILMSLHRVTEWLISDTCFQSRLNKSDSIGTLLACALAPEETLCCITYAKCSLHSHITEKERILDLILPPDTLVAQLSIDKWVECPGDPLKLAIKANFGWEKLLQRGALVTDSCIEALEGHDNFSFVETFINKIQPKNMPAHVNPRFLKLAEKLKYADRPLPDTFLGSIADIDSVGETIALQTAVTFGQTHAVLKILKKGIADINPCSKTDGLNALHRASKEGNLEVAKILLNHSASLDSPTSADTIDTSKHDYSLNAQPHFI